MSLQVETNEPSINQHFSMILVTVSV